jgi:hypothetical protein
MLTLVHTEYTHNYTSHKRHLKIKNCKSGNDGNFEVTSHKHHVGPDRISCYERLLITPYKTK